MINDIAMDNVEGRLLSGMYVVCNDNNLLDSVSHLLTKSGILGIRDQQGKTHYLIDARNDREKAVNAVGNLVSSADRSVFDNGIELEYRVIGVLKKYGFDTSLIGTIILKAILLTHASDDNGNPCFLKQIMLDMANTFGMTRDQMERDLRYAVNKSGMKGIRSKLVVRLLLDELVEYEGNKKAVS